MSWFMQILIAVGLFVFITLGIYLVMRFFQRKL